MSSNEERRFYFHAEGHAFSGVFHRPVSVPIEILASVSLPTIGGHAHTRIENFHIPRLVSFKSAHTHVSGSQQDVDTFTTQVTTTIEGLRILDFLTADRIVCRLTSEHLRKNKEGHILAIGSHFENLRIAGQLVKVNFNEDLVTKKSTFTQACENLAVGDDPKNPMAAGSIVEKVQDFYDDECDHQIEVRGFGKIFLGEFVVTPFARRLTMIRVELGSPIEGALNAADLAGNGGPIPP